MSLPLWIESKAFRKSTKVSTPGRFLYLMPSSTRRNVSIWATVDLPDLQPFWLMRSLGSRCGRILFRIILLYTLAPAGERVIL